MPHLLPPKKEVALALLERASVFVHLDPRANGVVVPMHFKKQPRLVLQIGLNMKVPIPDLRLDEQGLSCTLSFNRSLFHCVVPWTAIFALVGEDGRGMVWPDDVPQEVAREMAPRDGATTEKPEREKAAVESVPNPKKPHVALVGEPKRAKRNSKRARGGEEKRALVAVPKAPPSTPAQVTSIGPEANAEKARAEAADKSRIADTSDKSDRSDKTEAGSQAGESGAQRESRVPRDGARGGKRPPKRELPPYLRIVK